MTPARLLLFMVLGFSPALAAAQATIPLLTVQPLDGGGSNYSVSVQLLMLMTLLSLLPAVLLAMTCCMKLPRSTVLLSPMKAL